MALHEYPSTINWTGGMAEGFNYLNSVTNSWFSNMLLITIYLIFASGFYFARRDMFGGLAVGGFATFVLGLLFWLGGLISGITFTIVVGVAIVSFASLWLGKQD